MAQVSQDTLRLEILRDARDHYKWCQEYCFTGSAEDILCGLKAAECEAMMRELMGEEK